MPSLGQIGAVKIAHIWAEMPDMPLAHAYPLFAELRAHWQ
jgi:hypothetical protein